MSFFHRSVVVLAVAVAAVAALLMNPTSASPAVEVVRPRGVKVAPVPGSGTVMINDLGTNNVLVLIVGPHSSPGAEVNTSAGASTTAIPIASGGAIVINIVAGNSTSVNEVVSNVGEPQVATGGGATIISNTTVNGTIGR